MDNKNTLFHWCPFNTRSRSEQLLAELTGTMKKSHLSLINRELCNTYHNFVDHILKYLRGKGFIMSKVLFCLPFLLPPVHTNHIDLLPLCCFLFQVATLFTVSIHHHLHQHSPVSAFSKLFHTPSTPGKTCKLSREAKALRCLIHTKLLTLPKHFPGSQPTWLCRLTLTGNKTWLMHTS